MAVSLTSLGLLAILFFSSDLIAVKSDFASSLPPEWLGLEDRKLTHDHFYLHQNLTGPDPNVVRVAQAPTTTGKSLNLFGA